MVDVVEDDADDSFSSMSFLSFDRISGIETSTLDRELTEFSYIV
jgi:hypothetical protein